MLTQWIAARRNNFQRLRRIAQQVGRAVEITPYAALRDAALRDPEPMQPRLMDGLQVRWTVEVVNIRANGDLDVNIDLHADLPTWFGVMPSYRFCKKADESVYYG